ncbi:MAG: VPS10 domain-containing protein [Phycisphaerae bacterium]
MRSSVFAFAFILTFSIFAPPALALQDDEKSDKSFTAKELAGLKVRNVGPALMSGRICDFAVNPENKSEYYVAVCSGGVWKTENNGTTYKPIFDGQSSYSVGCVTLNPHNPYEVWVGSGENNSQRSVSFGDGVYRSRDGGKSWKNMGLKESEHIGNIVIDPRDPNVIYVAAQGPLWRSGGDRGLYKSTNGGESWERVLHISDDTGVNEVHMDPRNPDVLYASAYQRRRRVWTLINGGPESAIYKSTDGGESWRKLTSGLPSNDKGRIGMCVSPANPDTIYAIVEAAEGKGGLFRSTNRGETWSKRNSYIASSPQYYNELVCDPQDEDTFYSLDTFMRMSDDGGKTIKRVSRKNRHVDDHAMWIDPDDTNHMLVGCDGGIYESWDRAANWQYKPNLPITQFYRVSVDNSTPFYYVYGGTQDNNSKGGPSRTTDRIGIANSDWFITVGGDGYETQVDPEDPNILYAQWQYGGLIRHDRRSGEIVDIKPREAPGEEPYVWNWDSPLILSPHNHKRLYFAADRLFRSNDQGNSWEVISDDLTRGLDRNQLEVMGRIQSVDAVSKNRSTSIFGNAVSLTESPLVEGLLYVGTDDGLVHVTEDGGENWRKISLFPGVPDMAYVSCLLASRHNADRVYASFDNHKNGDFSPYLLRSDDRGQSWEMVCGDLPERDIVYTLAEDTEKDSLLFVGTEFGAYFTVNHGENWVKLKSGIPTIAIRDLDIQRRENDVVLGSFGRGIFILDDYTPIRHATAEAFKEDAHVFPVKDAMLFVQRSRLGGRDGRGSQGSMFYAAPNPPFGAVITYHLKEKLQTRKEKRQEAEKKAIKANKKIDYPTMDELRAEDQESAPKIWMLIRNEDGETVRRIQGSRNKGVHRIAWDLRYPSPLPARLSSPTNLAPWDMMPSGPLALPGTYTVTIAKEVDGEVSEITEQSAFDVVPLELATFAAADREAAMAFLKKAAKLQRAVRGAISAAGEYNNRMRYLSVALRDAPEADLSLATELFGLKERLNAVRTALSGDSTLARQQEPVPPSISSRSSIATDWYVTSAPTQTQRDVYATAAADFAEALSQLRSLRDELTGLEARMEAAGAPWTPGRLPDWSSE